MKTIQLLVVLGLFAACSAQDSQVVEPTTTPEKPAVTELADLTTGEARLAHIKNCTALLDTEKWEAIKACYNDTTKFENVQSQMMPPVQTGVDVAINQGKVFAPAFPDRKHAQPVILINGTKVAQIIHFTGTNTGPMHGQPATNKKLDMLFGSIGELNGKGQALRQATYWDETTMMFQMGAIPADKMPKDMTPPSQEEPWTQTYHVIATGNDTEAANITAFQKAVTDVNAGNFTESYAFYADDVSFRYVPMAMVSVTSKDALVTLDSEWMKGLDGLKVSVENIWAAGDWVVAETTFAATLKMNGKPFSSKYLEFTRFEGGKVKQHLIFANSMAWAAQVGLLPEMPKPDMSGKQPATK